MTILPLLIGVSLLAGAAALAAFIWSLSRGQYDDLEGAAQRALLEDDR